MRSHTNSIALVAPPDSAVSGGSLNGRLTTQNDWCAGNCSTDPARRSDRSSRRASSGSRLVRREQSDHGFDVPGPGPTSLSPAIARKSPIAVGAAYAVSCANISRLAKHRAACRDRGGKFCSAILAKASAGNAAHGRDRCGRRQLAAAEFSGTPADQPLSPGQGQHAGSLSPTDPEASSPAEGPAVSAKIAGRDAPPAQGSKIASVRTSIDSRGAASARVSGNSKALCGVKRARSPRLSQPLISRTSSRSILGA